MKRILFLVIGYFLCIQAGLGALIGFGNPENLVAIWAVSGALAVLGYSLIKKARTTKAIENAPTKELEVPETNRLDRK